MDYRQALDHVLGFANFEISSSKDLRYRDFNLTLLKELLDLVGNPHLAYPTVHIAGSKGKGSTAAMVASVARAAGLTTGLYTSPHLHTVRERIQVDGEMISEAAFAEGVEALLPRIAQVNTSDAWGRLSTFEVLTALGFSHLANRHVDVGVIEVGLGGRLDATSVVSPTVSVITSLSLDHMEVLGSTLGQIAAEKAAIIAPGVPVVSAPQQPEALEVVARAADRAQAPLMLLGRDVEWNRRLEEGCHVVEVATSTSNYELRLPLDGGHQAENAALAISACERLAETGIAIGRDAIEEGIANVKWPARMETICGVTPIVVDGAHNPYSAACFREAFLERFPDSGVVLVFGANRNKNLKGMVEELVMLTDRVIVTRSRHPKSAPTHDILAVFSECGVTGYEAGTVSEALTKARSFARQGEVIAATGSLFVAAEAREQILAIKPEIYPGWAPGMV